MNKENVLPENAVIPFELENPFHVADLDMLNYLTAVDTNQLVAMSQVQTTTNEANSSRQVIKKHQISGGSRISCRGVWTS